MTQRQEELEDKVSCLQSSFTGLKELFQERLTRAEDRIGELQYLNSQMQSKQVERLEELHQTILEV